MPCEKDLLLLALKWRKGALVPETQCPPPAGRRPQLTVSKNTGTSVLHLEGLNSSSSGMSRKRTLPCCVQKEAQSAYNLH